MLSLDLFDSKFERRLHEGAVDSTIEHLLKPLSLRAAEIKTQIRSGKLDPKQIDQLEKEYEDLVQKRLDIILDREPKTEQQQPQKAPAKGLLKGKDLVTPQQRVAGATPAKPGIGAAVKDVVGGIKRFVKGEPDQGPTFEQTDVPDPNEIDPSQFPEYRIARELVAAWRGEQDYVKLPLLDGSSVPLTRPAMYNALVQLTQMTKRGHKKYVAYLNKILADEDTFLRWLAGVKRYKTPPKKKGAFEKGEPVQQTLGLTPPPVQAAEPAPTAPAGPMVDPEFRQSAGIVKERQGKKKKSKQAPVRDAQLIRAIQQARAKFPTAASDVEAFSKDQLEINTKQDKELSDLEQQLQKVQRDNTALSTLIKDLDKQTQKPQVQPKASAVTPSTAPVSKVPTPTAVPAAQPVPTELPPVTAEPPEEKPTDKAKTTAKKPRVKKLPSKDMGKADEIPRQRQLGFDLDGDRLQAQLPGKKSKDSDIVDLDLDTVSGDLAKQAISRAKQKSKAKVEVEEHGGGIGPKQHWQSLMRETGRQPMDTINYYFPDINAQSDVEAIRSAIRQIMDNPELSKTSKQRLLGQIGMMVQRNRALIGREWRQYLDRFSESQHNEQFGMPGTTVPRKSVIQGYTVFFNPETRTISVTRGGDSEEAAIEQARIGTVNLKTFRQAAERLIDKIEGEEQAINESVKDVASATAVIACLLTGGSLTGCATAPQQTTSQQVLKTGQDVARTVQTAKKITRAGVEAEVNQEIRNLARGMGTRPEELNHSNILRLWRRLQGQPPVPPEPQAPEYGPAEPVRRPATFEAKEPANQQEYFAMIDRLDKEIRMEQDRAVRQMLMSRRAMLQQRAQSAGWIPQKELREDTAALAAEDAILKRIFVKHRDLMMEYGPDKITQAAEEVAYNVGDIAHITDEQINEWVGQVEYILGARP